ncbi:DUF1223 domain-containing protein [Sphingomonas koreensis]|nr:DUF1223 domain-containing protein [Sphingomonas koreensis]
MPSAICCRRSARSRTFWRGAHPSGCPVVSACSVRQPSLSSQRGRRGGFMLSIAPFRIIAVTLGGVFFAATIAAAGAPPRGHPVAVELFTSQGCSSCPPADAVMEKLARDPQVVAITRPVTYWDQLGWKDTLARPANTELQRAYTARKIAGAGVYTPQSVIAGRAGTVGGREAQIRQLIAAAARLPEPALAITRSNDGGRTIQLDGKTNAAASVSLVALRGLTTVAVGRGENGGRKVVYANSVIGETSIGAWRGGAMRFAIPASSLHVSGAARYALLVRQGSAGPILAARYL